MFARYYKRCILLIYGLIMLCIIICMLKSDEQYIRNEYNAYVVEGNKVYEAKVNISGIIIYYSDMNKVIYDWIYDDDKKDIFDGCISIEWNGIKLEYSGKSETEDLRAKRTHIKKAKLCGSNYVYLEKNQYDEIELELYIDTFNDAAPSVLWINNSYEVDKSDKLCVIPIGDADFTKEQADYCIRYMDYKLSEEVKVIEKFPETDIEKECEIIFGIIVLAIITILIAIIFDYKNMICCAENMIKEKEYYYLDLLDREEETRKFRHDFKAFLILLRNKVNQGNITDIKELTDEINEYMNDSISKKYVTGNEVLDSYINYYLPMLPDNITVKVYGCITKRIPLKEIELGIVLDNLFKNTITSLSESKIKGYVIVDIKSGKQFVSIRIKNNIPNDVQRNRNRIYNLGYGIANVKNILKKNGGTIEILDNREEYEVVITLNTISPLEKKL